MAWLGLAYITLTSMYKNSENVENNKEMNYFYDVFDVYYVHSKTYEFSNNTISTFCYLFV